MIKSRSWAFQPATHWLARFQASSLVTTVSPVDSTTALGDCTCGAQWSRVHGKVTPKSTETTSAPARTKLLPTSPSLQGVATDGSAQCLPECSPALHRSAPSAAAL